MQRILEFKRQCINKKELCEEYKYVKSFESVLVWEILEIFKKTLESFKKILKSL